MKTNYNLSYMARIVESKIAHKAILAMGNPSLLQALAENKSITADIWGALYKIKDLDIRCSLALSATNEKDMLLLLQDTRATVKASLAVRGMPKLKKAQLLELINQNYFDSNLASLMLRSNKTPKPLIKHFAQIANNEAGLRYLADPKLYTLEQAKAFLQNVVLYEYQKGQHVAVNSVLDQRPELLEILHQTGQDRFLLSIAQSQHLTDEIIMLDVAVKAVKIGASRHYARAVLITLLLNPNTTTKVRDLVVKSLGKQGRIKTWIGGAPLQGIHYVLRHIRAKKENKLTPPVTIPWDQTTGEQQDQILQFLSCLNARWRIENSYPTLTNWYRQVAQIQVHKAHDPEPAKEKLLSELFLSNNQMAPNTTPEIINKQLAAILDPLGEKAWVTYLTLLPDWNQDMQSLAENVISIHN